MLYVSYDFMLVCRVCVCMSEFQNDYVVMFASIYVVSHSLFFICVVNLIKFAVN